MAITKTITIQGTNLDELQGLLDEAKKAVDLLQCALQKINCFSVNVEVTDRQTASG